MKNVIKENLICPECHKEIMDNTKICMNCGYPLGHFSFAKGKKKIIFFSLLIVILIISTILTTTCIGGNKKRISQQLIEEDLGEEITYSMISYNSNKNICFVEFKYSSTSDTDIAMVNLESKQIGYDSIMCEYLNETNKYSGQYESGKYQKAAHNVTNYSKLYDNLAFLAAKQEQTDWDIIYP